MTEPKIRKGAGPRHDPTCYELTRDIVIPAGTVLRSVGDGKFAAPVGNVAEFSIRAAPHQIFTDFRRVVA